jgi:hypothetical protein
MDRRAGGGPTQATLAIELYAVAAKLRALDRSDVSVPRLRVRTRAGRWAVIYAAWLATERDRTVAVIIEEAGESEIAALTNLAAVAHREIEAGAGGFTGSAPVSSSPPARRTITRARIAPSTSHGSSLPSDFRTSLCSGPAVTTVSSGANSCLPPSRSR